MKPIGILLVVAAIMALTVGYMIMTPPRVDAERNLTTQARQYAEAIIQNDYAKLIAMTDARLVKAAGGAEALARQREENARKNDALWPERSIKVGKITSMAEAGGQRYGIVPFVLDIKSETKHGRILSYLVGISNDAGKTWKFVDGRGQPRAELVKFLPELPAELEVPEVDSNAGGRPKS